MSVFPQMHTKQSICEFQILIPLVKAVMCLSMGGLEKLKTLSSTSKDFHHGLWNRVFPHLQKNNHHPRHSNNVVSSTNSQ